MSMPVYSSITWKAAKSCIASESVISHRADGGHIHHAFSQTSMRGLVVLLTRSWTLKLPIHLLPMLTMFSVKHAKHGRQKVTQWQ